MEIKIGVRNTPREIVVESTLTPEAVAEHVAAAVNGGGVLTLSDGRGRFVHVPVEALAYVETGAGESRRVGFGNTANTGTTGNVG